MATALTVHAYGNVDALHGIFNAVAMVMGSDDFAGMVRIGAVIGFAVVATLAILPGNLQRGWTWFVAVTVITGVLLLPRANVSIEDKLGRDPTVVVGDVPWALALMMSVKTTLGSELTRMFETAFQTIPSPSRTLPAELSYLEHGMMFGARLVRGSRDAMPDDLYDQTDLVQYVRNCVLPAVGRGATPNQLFDSVDLRAAMASTNMGLASGYHDPARNWQLVIDGCANVWAALQGRLNAAGAKAVVKAAARDLGELYKLNPSAAVDKLEAALPAIYGKAALASAGSSAADIMVQNILINATADAAALQGASINDTTLIQLASMRTQAMAQMNAGNLVQGRIAEESLPLVRNITEAILVAVFPVLCILLVASEGRALAGLFKSYCYALVWVELWPPMFAVVNYLQTLAQAKELAGAGFVAAGTSGLTIGTASTVYSTAVSGMGTAAWMVTFVPVIAAACLFGFDRIMAITGAMGGGQRGAQSEAAQATKGNLSLGAVSMHQQQLMASQTDPTVFRRDTLGGTEWGSALGGARLADWRQASVPVSLSDTATVTRGMAAEASTAQASAQRHSKAHDEAIDAAYGQVQTVLKSHGKSTQRTLGFEVGEMSSDGLLASESREAAERIAKRYGISDASEVAKALRAGAQTPSLLSFGMSLSTQERQSLQRDISMGSDDLKKKGLQRKQELVDQYRSNDAFADARRSNRDATDRVEAAMRRAASYKEAESFDLTRSKELRAKIEGAERFQRESTARWDTLIDRFARSRYGVSVDDGVADPRFWQQVVVPDFVRSGTVRFDTDDGKPMWIAPDPGLGLNAVRVDPRTAQSVAAGGSGAIDAEFAGAAPGGGRTAVESGHGGNKAKVDARGVQLGVSSWAEVGAGGLRKQVQGQHANARQAVEQAGREAGKSAGAQRLDYDERAGQVSSTHRPILTQNPLTNERIANKALDAVRGTDGTLPKTFGSEAEAERRRRAEESAKAHQEAANARIPK